MTFARPSAFWLLLFVLAGFLLSLIYQKTLQKKLSQWIDRSMWKQIIPEYRESIFTRRFIFVIISLFFLLFSLARPQWGEREEMIQSHGQDILVLLDLSNSMLAEDTPPSRLNRAQTFIKKLLQNLSDDRVGIVGFAGKAFLTVPLTTDFGYVTEMTETLDPAAIMSQGTDIGKAIDVAIKAFERGAEDDRKTTRSIILISDGEDFGEAPLKVAERIKDFGSTFFVLSVGTPEGGPIPIRNEAGVLQTYKKDRNEKPVISRVNRELMSKIAETAGGKFLELVNADDAAYAVSKALRSSSKGSQKEQRHVTKIDRFQIFLAISVFFQILALFTGYRKVFRLFILLLIPTFAQAQSFDSYLKSKKAERHYSQKDFEGSAQLFEDAKRGDPENPKLDFNQGTALGKAKKNEEAIGQLSQATKKSLSQGDYETAARSLYNEGVLQAEQKNLPESYDRLTKAIELSKISNQPSVERMAREALINLIEKQKQQSQQQKEQGQKDQKGSQDQKKGENGESPEKQKQDEKQNSQVDDTKKRDFKSGTLSKDVAESIMNDLSDREKQLYQHRMKERRPREVPNDKDW